MELAQSLSVLDNETKIYNDSADHSADKSVLLPLVQSSSAELLHGKIAESSSQNMHSPSYNSPTPTRGSMGESAANLGQKKVQGTGVFLGGRYSTDDVIKFGGISEKSAVGVRPSDRIRAQPNADVSQLQRAQERAQIRDYGISSGTKLISKFNLASLPNEIIVARASKLGVSLGVTPSQVDSSIVSIKDLDLERTLTMLKWKENNQKILDEGTVTL
jgi:hypothetical protein